MDYLLPNAQPVDVHKRVIEYVAGNSSWNISQFSSLVPATITNWTIGMVPPNISNIFDCLAWKNENDAMFSLASVYAAIQRNVVHPWKKLYLAIWNWRGSEWIRLFLWKASYATFLTNERRYRRGMANTDVCVACNSEVETHFHVFRDCEPVKLAWEVLLGGRLPHFFLNQDWQDWLFTNLSNTDEQNGVTWSRVFGVMLVKVGRRRNELVFNNAEWSINELVHKTRRMIDAIEVSDKGFGRVAG